jgi:hypothetical protein
VPETSSTPSKETDHLFMGMELFEAVYDVPPERYQQEMLNAP